MKITSAVLLTSLIVAGAVCPRAAEATTVKVVSPDPNCTPTPPASELVIFTGTATLPSGASGGAGSTPGTIDASVFTTSNFVNCNTSDPNIDALTVSLDNVTSPLVVTLTGSSFDGYGFDTNPMPPGDAVIYLYCDEATYGGTCTGLGSDPSDNGVGISVVSEPTEAELLLFGIGISFLGFGGWKGWKRIGSRVSQGTLAAS